jgi:hypothetical protein
VDRSIVDGRPAAGLGHEQLVQARGVGHAERQRSLDLEADRHAKERKAVGVVGRAIERIDDPAVARVAAGVRTALFAQDGMRRKCRQNRAQDLALALQVDVGDDVDGTLVADLVDRVDPAAQQLAGGRGGLDRDRSGVAEIELGRGLGAQRFVNRAAAAGATFSGGSNTMAPLSQLASHR